MLWVCRLTAEGWSRPPQVGLVSLCRTYWVGLLCAGWIPGGLTLGPNYRAVAPGGAFLLAKTEEQTPLH